MCVSRVTAGKENEADMALDIPALPLITARFGGDSGELIIDGVRESITAENTEQLRERILGRVSEVASELGRPVQVITEDEEGQWLLAVHPDGEVGEEERLDGETPPEGEHHAPHAPHAPHAHEAGAAVVERGDAHLGEPEVDEDFDGVDDLDGENSTNIVTSPVNVQTSSWYLGLGTGPLPVSSSDIVAEPISAHTFVPVPESAAEPAYAPAAEPAFEPTFEPASEPAFAPASEPAFAPASEPGAAIWPASLPVSAAEPEPESSPHRASFLAEERKPDRAKQGWRGVLAKTGLPIPASARELTERAETHAVSQHWAGPRTIAIVNGKGGANKTPTTALLAALFARNGGAGVLAWDNNETRGTLGWRTEQGPHDATVQSLLPNVDHLLSPEAQSSDLSAFVHHQTGDKYDVLRSNPTMLATQQRITTDDFDKLHSVAAKYFRLIFIDSGNDESAERWLRMIDHTDQLVIATTALGEHAEAGALLLEALAQRDERSARLASQAVVIVSQSERTGTLTDARKVAAGFEPLARRTVSVPFDPSIHGGRLEYSALAPATRRAWLRAAAAVAEGL